jgi:hypothetical protein
MLLSTLVVGPMGIALIITVSLLAACLGYLAFKGDAALKHRRMDAMKASGNLRSKGLEILPNMLDDLAVGDLVSLEHRIRDFIDVLNNPKKLDAEFEKVVAHINDAKLKDPATRLPYLKSLVTMANSYSEQKYALGFTAPPAPTAAPASAAAPAANGPSSAAAALGTITPIA